MLIVKLNITTDAAGAGTTTSDLFQLRDRPYLLYAVQLIDGDFDDLVDITLTAEQGDLSIPLYTKADWNTDQIIYPRAAVVLNTDGSALTVYDLPLVVGQLKAVIAQGGNVKSGSVICYLREF